MIKILVTALLLPFLMLHQQRNDKSETSINRTPLFQVSVPIVSNEKCKSMFLRAGRHEVIPEIFMCAGYDLGGRDSCQVIQPYNTFENLSIISQWWSSIKLTGQPWLLMIITIIMSLTNMMSHLLFLLAGWLWGSSGGEGKGWTMVFRWHH